MSIKELIKHHSWQRAEKQERKNRETLDYRFFMIFMRSYVNEDAKYYDFFIDLLVHEIIYGGLLEIGRGGDEERYEFPFSHMDSQLLGYKYDESVQTIVDVRENNVIAVPWKDCRYKKAIHGSGKLDLERHEQSSNAIYYDGLNVTWVTNARHRIGVAAYIGHGKIKADYYDVCKIFPYVDADEYAFSYNKEAILERMSANNEPIPEDFGTKIRERFEQTDFKLRLLYTLCKEKWEKKEPQIQMADKHPLWKSPKDHWDEEW